MKTNVVTTDNENVSIVWYAIYVLTNEQPRQLNI